MDKETQLVKQLHDIHKEAYQVWLNEIIFTWRWWLGVTLTILPWIIWFCFRKQESTDRLLYSAFFVMLIASYLDFIGVQLGLWSYPNYVIPTIPSFIPWDVSLFPVIVMFFIQICPEVNPWLKAAIFGISSSFIPEPLFSWLDLYHPLHWSPFYSLPILIVIYRVAHALSERTCFVFLSKRD